MNPLLWNRMNRAERKRVRALRELERRGVDSQVLLQLMRRIDGAAASSGGER